MKIKDVVVENIDCMFLSEGRRILLDKNSFLEDCLF